MMYKPPEPAKNSAVVPQTENQDTTRLFHALQQKERQPNVITRAAFVRFEPLFRKNNGLTIEQITDLTKKYVAIIDLYNETQIIDSNTNPVVLVTLPPIFTPVRSLSHTRHNLEVVSINRNYANNAIPRYTSEAFSNMIIAVRNEQTGNGATVSEYRKRYGELVAEFFEKYTPADAPAKKALSAPIVSVVPEGTEWD